MASGLPSRTGSTWLTLAEAVPLGHALLDSVAKDLGVRALAIKGPVLALQGLRDVKESIDIDVLVDPRGFTALLARMLDLGWVDTEPYDLPTVMPRHSATLRHATWPCEVDLHHYFPGFLAEPQVVFDELWQNRVQIEMAARQVNAPSPDCHALLSALHYLRDRKSEEARERLTFLINVMRDWPREQLQTLVDIAVATGADATVSPVLDALQVTRAAPAVRPGLEAWRLRSETETTAALAWWVALGRAPWWQKPARLKQAAWPSTQDMNRFLGVALPEGPELRKARLARLRRGMSQLPRAAREYHRVKRRHRRRT